MGFLTKIRDFFGAINELEKMKKSDPELAKDLDNFYANQKLLREELKKLDQQNSSLIIENDDIDSRLKQILDSIPSNLTNLQWDDWSSKQTLPIPCTFKCFAVNVDLNYLSVQYRSKFRKTELALIEISPSITKDKLMNIKKEDYIEVDVNITDIRPRTSTAGCLRMTLIDIRECNIEK
jgi:hypothetical protein